MKQVVAIAGSALAAAKSGGVVEISEHKPVEFKGALADWFNEIFPEILMACPKWGLTISGDGMMRAAKRVWLQALADNGVTKKHMVSRGIKALQDRGQEYLPSAAEFCRLCKDDDKKLPSLDAAMMEIMIGNKPWSCDFVAYLAGKCGTILHPTTAKDMRGAAFKIEYDRAMELAGTGYFEQGGTPRIESQAMDENLAHYAYLAKSFPDSSYADEFLDDCRMRGIYLDVENKTVTRDANLVDHSKQRL